MASVLSQRKGPTASSPTPAADPSHHVQLKAKARGLDFASGAALLAPEAVQADGGTMSSPDVQAVAATGTAGASGRLPHAAQIQQAFGHHDVSPVQAQVGGAADAACETLGASAYASGDRVAFAGSPDLHTAAHEAAHVVQQRAGVQLSGGVGQRGDRYEQHADAVADAVVAGRSAEPLLDAQVGGGALRGSGTGVQLYSKKTKDYTEQKDDQSTIPMFTNELADPQVKGQDDQAKIAYDRQNVDNPMMRFADDNTMGIQATKRVDPLKGGSPELTHAKELYVSAASLADANQRLTGVGSMVRLAPTGHQVTRKGNALLGVKPGIAGQESETVAQEMVNLRTNICIELAKNIIAGEATSYKTHAVLDDGQGNRSLAKIGSTGTDSAEVSQLGQHLGGGGGGSHDEARGAMTGGAAVTPGEAYGTRLGEGGLEDQSRELGINEHAKPKAGEGYGIYTMGGNAGHEKTDYSVLTEEQPTERENIWGYHYAGVVATSEDGNDNATLENYNRKADILRAKKHLLAQLKQDFAGVLDDIANLSKDDAAGPTDARLKEAYARIEAAGRSNGRNAQDMFRTATQADSNNAWFFSMFGSNPGQSFHEQMAKTGAFANPLTVRVSNEIFQALEPFKNELGGKAPKLPAPIAQDPAFANIVDARKAIADAGESASSLDQIRGVVAQAMDTYRDYLRNAIWSAIGNLLEHTGVHLPPNVPPDFVGLRGALGDIAGQLNQKSERTFTRAASNERRRVAHDACHMTADWIIRVESWLGGCLALL